MAAIALDTLRVSRRLRDAGFSEPQAEATTSVLGEAQGSALSELATKHDLALTKGELQLGLAALRADVGLLKWMFGVNTALVVGILLKLFST